MHNHSLTSAIQLSQDILSAIDLEDWSEVSRLDDSRKKLIHGYFEQAESVDYELTQTLKALNDTIVSKLLGLQLQTRSAQIDIKQARHASNVYLDIAGR